MKPIKTKKMKNTERQYNYDLKYLDLDTLNVFEYQEFNNLICYHNKIDALKIIIGNVKKQFNQLSINLGEIAEIYN